MTSRVDLTQAAMRQPHAYLAGAGADLAAVIDETRRLKLHGAVEWVGALTPQTIHGLGALCAVAAQEGVKLDLTPQGLDERQTAFLTDFRAHGPAASREPLGLTSPLIAAAGEAAYALWQIRPRVTKPKAPELSVMVTVVEGEPALSCCLEALSRQENCPAMEVIVPYDDTVAEVGKLVQPFPDFTFLNLGKVALDSAPPNPFTEHEYFDRRRSAGLAAAASRLIAMLEDRGAPRADRAREMVAEHDRTGAAVIGGAVINVAPGTINKALFVCDYGRYSPPFVETRAEYLTDINLCYSRAALESTREVWGTRYLEASVHWTLRDQGGLLLLSPKPVVLHERGKGPLSRTISERLHWGRIFGITRGARWTNGRAFVAAVAAVILPLVLLLRHTRAMAAKGGEILQTALGMTVVLPFRCFGEALGYLQGAGKTDVLTKARAS